MGELNITDILRKSKALMNSEALKVKGGSTTQNNGGHNPSMEKPLPEFNIPESTASAFKNVPVNEQTIMNSGLPDAIKKAMLETPIDPEAYMDVTKNPAYADLIEEEYRSQQPQPQVQNHPTYQQPQPKVVTENLSNLASQSSLSESVIRFIVREEIEKVMSNKKPQVSENDIKNTMIKMIKEGKLTISKK